jgi:hypothetical protein
VNYAHHDNIGDYQALLMLSQPGVDYDGGMLLDVLVEVVHKSKPTTKLVGRHVLACCIKIYVKEMLTMAKYEMLFVGL